MKKNDIKKALYKQAPVAYFDYIRKGTAYYIAKIRKEVEYPEEMQGPLGATYRVIFAVPVSDMGDADFHSEMAAKWLIRYLVVPEEVL